MAEEDLIFGKNRHFFGGIEPSNMQAFSVAVGSGVVKVTATLPNDTVYNFYRFWVVIYRNLLLRGIPLYHAGCV